MDSARSFCIDPFWINGKQSLGSFKARLNIFLSGEKEQKGGIMKKKGDITKKKTYRIFYQICQINYGLPTMCHGSFIRKEIQLYVWNCQHKTSSNMIVIFNWLLCSAEAIVLLKTWTDKTPEVTSEGISGSGTCLYFLCFSGTSEMLWHFTGNQNSCQNVNFIVKSQQ